MASLTLSQRMTDVTEVSSRVFFRTEIRIKEVCCAPPYHLTIGDDTFSGPHLIGLGSRNQRAKT